MRRSSSRHRPAGTTTPTAESPREERDDAPSDWSTEAGPPLGATHWWSRTSTKDRVGQSMVNPRPPEGDRWRTTHRGRTCLSGHHPREWVPAHRSHPLRGPLRRATGPRAQGLRSDVQRAVRTRCGPHCAVIHDPVQGIAPESTANPPGGGGPPPSSARRPPAFHSRPDSSPQPRAIPPQFATGSP